MKNERLGKLFFISADPGKDEKFGMFQEVNSNFDYLTSIHLGSGRALGITCNEEVLEWKRENKKLKKERSDFSFLTKKPTYQFYKMKFTKILVNRTVCLGLENYGNVFVWGSHKDGLLGLGYNITSVENPTKLEILKNIQEMSMSENHAVVLDNAGEAYSWGTGKYGELGLERTIYSPFPGKMSINRQYSKVFCSDLLTCFLDQDGKFSYFGVIIKILKGSHSSITLKNLLNDESTSNPLLIFQERFIYELEEESFITVSIGNGFIGLLSTKGMVYTLDFSDNITLLFSQFFVYSLSVSCNQLFGLCKEINKQTQVPATNRSTSLCEFSSNEDSPGLIQQQQVNYYLNRWIASFMEGDVTSDAWSSNLYKISNEINIESMRLADSTNKSILFFFESDSLLREPPMKFCQSSKNRMSPVFSKLKRQSTAMVYKIEKEENMNINLNMNMNNNLNASVNVSVSNNRYADNEECAGNITYNDLTLGCLGVFKKNNLDSSIEALSLVAVFDDSYNMKYKRLKNFHGARVLTGSKKMKSSEILMKSSSEVTHEKIKKDINDIIKKATSSNLKRSSEGDNEAEGKIFENNHEEKVSAIPIPAEKIKKVNENNEIIKSNSEQIKKGIHDTEISEGISEMNIFSEEDVQSCDNMNFNLNANAKHTTGTNQSNPKKRKQKFQSEDMKRKSPEQSPFGEVYTLTLTEENRGTMYNCDEACEGTATRKDSAGINHSPYELRENNSKNYSVGDSISSPHSSYRRVKKMKTDSEIKLEKNTTEKSNENSNSNATQELIISSINDIEKDIKSVTLTKESNNITMNDAQMKKNIEKSYSFSDNNINSVNSSEKRGIISEKNSTRETLSNNNPMYLKSRMINLNLQNLQKKNNNQELMNTSQPEKVYMTTEVLHHNLKIDTNYLQFSSKNNSINIEDEILDNITIQDNLSHSNSHFRNNEENESNPNFLRYSKKAETTINKNSCTFTDDDHDHDHSSCSKNSCYFNSTKNIARLSPISAGIEEQNHDKNLLIQNAKMLISSFGLNYKDNLPGSSSSEGLFQKILRYNSQFNLLFSTITRAFMRTGLENIKIQLAQSKNETVDKRKKTTKEIFEDNQRKVLKNMSKANKNYQYFSKIFYRMMTVLYRRNKKEFFGYLTFQKIFAYGRQKKIKEVLPKFLHKKLWRDTFHCFNRWKKYFIIYSSLNRLNAVRLNRIYTAFCIFKHKLKIFTVKKKYYSELFQLLEKSYVKLMKSRFMINFHKFLYYQAHFEEIKKHLQHMRTVISLNVKEFIMKILKQENLKLRLKNNNIAFLFSIIDKKNKGIKKIFYEKLKHIYNLKVLLCNLVSKKHITRIFFLKKTFKALRKLALETDEKVFMWIKMKKALKCLMYRWKLNLMKYLYKWNNNATKKSKIPRQLKPVFNYKINDLRNKFRLNRVPGLSSSFTDKNEKFAKVLMNFMQKHVVECKRKALEVIAKYSQNLSASTRKISPIPQEKINININTLSLKDIPFEQPKAPAIPQDSTAPKASTVKNINLPLTTNFSNLLNTPKFKSSRGGNGTIHSTEEMPMSEKSIQRDFDTVGEQSPSCSNSVQSSLKKEVSSSFRNKFTNGSSKDDRKDLAKKQELKRVGSPKKYQCPATKIERKSSQPSKIKDITIDDKKHLLFNQIFDNFRQSPRRSKDNLFKTSHIPKSKDEEQSKRNMSMPQRSTLKGNDDGKFNSLEDTLVNISEIHNKNSNDITYPVMPQYSNLKNVPSASTISIGEETNLQSINDRLSSRAKKANSKRFSNVKVLMEILRELFDSHRQDEKRNVIEQLRKNLFRWKNKEKVYATKILYRMLKKRIIFYKLKFVHRSKLMLYDIE